MTNNFIKQIIERILNIDPEEHISPNKFVQDWKIAGEALLAIQRESYTIEMAYVNENYVVTASRWDDDDVDGETFEYAFSTGENQPKCILEVLIKIQGGS